MKHLLELFFFFIVSLPLAVLPHRISLKAGESLGLLTYYLWSARRKIAIENIQHAMERGAISSSKSPAELIKENFIHMGRYLAEMTKIYLGLGDDIVKRINVKGIGHFEEAKRMGKGVILFSGHFSNWELLVLSISSKIDRMYGIARKQSNPYIDRFIVRTRERFGSSIVYKQGALKKFISILKDGGNVGVMIDQAVMPDEGVLIDFLGAPAWTTKMPVAIAMRTGAALVPIFLSRTGAGYEIILYPPVELKGDAIEDTKRLSSYVEAHIKENPSQWLWVHRRWKRT